jgi:hypothetical protein
MQWIIVLSTHVPRAGVENLKEKPGIFHFPVYDG